MTQGARTLEALFDRGILIEGDPAWYPTGITDDSRCVQEGFLFIARRGLQDDGMRFIADALERGAGGVLLDETCSLPESCTIPVTIRTRDVVGSGTTAVHRFHGEPARSLEVIAITGTNGKTTVAWFVRAMLAAAGRRCGLMGTIEVDDGRACRPAELTTPAACAVAEALARMVANGCDAVVLEASSHALEQGRLSGIRPARALFTNLSGDHLDYHGSIEAYASAKARLFGMLQPEGLAIVNADDMMHARMIQETEARVLRCSTSNDAHDAEVRVLEMDRNCSMLEFIGPWGRFTARVKLPGRHNAENLLLAVACVHSLGVSMEVLEPSLAALEAPPGRLQPVTGPEAPFSVLVDYAHTDHALENVLKAARPLVKGAGRLSVVFGCGGDRDSTKRSRMARVACSLADRVFITSDNPRTEDPEAIIKDILVGVPDGGEVEVSTDVDRAASIRQAIAEAVPGEIVVIAGKGHEDYQIIGTSKRDFDDRRVAAEALGLEVST